MANLIAMAHNVPITDPETGNPTPEFIRLMSRLSVNSSFTIDKTGKISFAAMSSKTVLANITGASATPAEATLTQVLDLVGSAAQGDILYRNATGWVRLAAGSSGFLLQTNGPTANPAWVTPPTGGGAGTTPTIKSSNLATYSAASIAVPFPVTPSVPVAGDIAVVFCENGFTVPTFPVGWNALYNPLVANYTNGIVVAKILTAGDITTGSCTIGWAGSYDGTYACVIINGASMIGSRDFVGSATAGSTSFASVVTTPSLLMTSTDLVLGFASSRGNGAVAITNFTALNTAVTTTNSSGFLGKYTGSIGKFGLSETASMATANNGIVYNLIALR